MKRHAVEAPEGAESRPRPTPRPEPLERTESQSRSDGGRPISTTPAATTAPPPQRRYWQPPFSCLFCRAKKLRCDRARPCGNCTSRGLGCKYAGDEEVGDDGEHVISGSSGGEHAEHRQSSVATTGIGNGTRDSRLGGSRNVRAREHGKEHANVGDYESEIMELKARLRRLENAVFANTVHHSTNKYDGHEQRTASSSRDASGANGLPGGEQEVEGNSNAQKDDANHTEPESGALDVMERMAINPNESVSISNGQVLPESQNPDIPGDSSPENRMLLSSLPNPESSPRYTPFLGGAGLKAKNADHDLPAQAIARELFDYYIDHINVIYRELHVPTARAMLDRVYQQVEDRSQSINTSEVALLFGIFANSAYYWPKTTTASSKLSHQVRDHWSLWRDISTAQLVNGMQTNGPSTVLIQTASILAHLFWNSEGPSPLLQFIRSSYESMARQLMIHKQDTPRQKEENKRKGISEVELEIRRRLWWHVVSIDGLLATLAGPNEGFYTLHPKQMCINLPANVNDDQVGISQGEPILTSTKPTAMSIFILRIKLAEICREIADSLPQSSFELRDMPYDTLLRLDARLQEFNDSLPVFAKTDPVSIKQSEHLCRDIPYFSLGRTVMNLGLQIRLSRLHRPFLFRGAVDARYAYSRIVCIRSAEKCIDLQLSVDAKDLFYAVEGSYSINHHIFVAAIILTVEVCFNKSNTNTKRLTDKILAACAFLERTQNRSRTAKLGIKNGLKLLVDMLKRHGVVDSCGQTNGTQVRGKDAGRTPTSLPSRHQTLCDINKTSDEHDSSSAARRNATTQTRNTIVSEPSPSTYHPESCTTQNTFNNIFDPLGSHYSPSSSSSSKQPSSSLSSSSSAPSSANNTRTHLPSTTSNHSTHSNLFNSPSSTYSQIKPSYTDPSTSYPPSSSSYPTSTSSSSTLPYTSTFATSPGITPGITPSPGTYTSSDASTFSNYADYADMDRMWSDFFDSTIPHLASGTTTTTTATSAASTGAGAGGAFGSGSGAGGEAGADARNGFAGDDMFGSPDWAGFFEDLNIHFGGGGGGFAGAAGTAGTPGEGGGVSYNV